MARRWAFWASAASGRPWRGVRALGFGMPVLYHARRPVDLAAQAPELQGRATPAPLGDLLARADIVLAMLPLTDATRGMIDATVFAAHEARCNLHQRWPWRHRERRRAARPHSTTAHCAPPASTCSPKEPLPADSPLRTHPRVTPLPPIGSATHETRHAMAELATTNLLKALAGERPTAVDDTASHGLSAVSHSPAGEGENKTSARAPSPTSPRPPASPRPPSRVSSTTASGS